MSSLVDYVSTNWKQLALVGTAGFIGYAIYFDYKRRSAPDYQQKIRQNRANKSSTFANVVLPNMSNPQEVQQFFLQEVQLGEELMASGNPGCIKEGAEHLANAIIYCGQSEQLLSIFQQTFPNEHFQLILSKIPEAQNRMRKHLLKMQDAHGPMPGHPTLSANSDELGLGAEALAIGGGGGGVEIGPVDDDDLE